MEEAGDAGIELPWRLLVGDGRMIIGAVKLSDEKVSTRSEDDNADREAESRPEGFNPDESEPGSGAEDSATEMISVMRVVTIAVTVAMPPEVSKALLRLAD